MVRTVSEDGASVIGLDVDLSKPGADDALLADACADAGNVIAFASVAWGDSEAADDDSDGAFFRPGAADGSADWSSLQASDLSLPSRTLLDTVTPAVANATKQSADGSIRKAALSLPVGGKDYDSFAAAVYRRNQEALGLSCRFLRTDSEDLFGFNVIWDTGSYQRISVCDLLSGSSPPELIRDHIVIVGMYQELPGPKLVDNVTLRRESQDILLQASMIQSLLKQRTVEELPPEAQAALSAFLIASFYLIVANRKIWFILIAYSIFVSACYSAAITANLNGQRVLLLVPLLGSAAALVVMLLQHLLLSTLERRRMEKTLKLYMDSSVVDHINETDPTNLAALSARKEIAILFVDVRGFTTLSERLQPEQVVEILNAYFTIVANAVNRWGGTLDKFIGDAAMAIFNAPRPLADYRFYAVCAADEIIEGFQAVKGVYEKKFHQHLNIGIGINAGVAIVGNIGCYSRMDYTAIGDAVNTASRLESSAAPGQILVSEPVAAALRERAKLNCVGELTLKGKARTVKTYEVSKIDRPKQAPFDRKELLESLMEQKDRMEDFLEENRERVGELLEKQKEQAEELIGEQMERVGELFGETERSRPKSSSVSTPAAGRTHKLQIQSEEDFIT